MANFEKELNLHCLAWRKKNRGYFEIMASMLEAMKHKGTTRYSIMKHTGTNYTQLNEYLGALDEIGFIETNAEERRVLYRPSNKGLGFLRLYHVLLKKMSSMRARTTEMIARPPRERIVKMGVCTMCGQPINNGTRKRFCSDRCRQLQNIRSKIPRDWLLTWFEECAGWVPQPRQLAIHNLRTGKKVFDLHTMRYVEPNCAQHACMQNVSKLTQ